MAGPSSDAAVPGAGSHCFPGEQHCPNTRTGTELTHRAQEAQCPAPAAPCRLPAGTTARLLLPGATCTGCSRAPSQNPHRGHIRTCAGTCQAPHERAAVFPKKQRQIWNPVSTNHFHLSTRPRSAPEHERSSAVQRGRCMRGFQAVRCVLD